MQVDPLADLQRELEADYRHYALAGTHAEIGQQLAAFPAVGMRLEHQQLPFARECARIMRAEHSGLWEELMAWADALKLDESRLLWHLTLGLAPGACSAVALAAPDGPLVLRNYDFFYFATRRHLVTTCPRAHLAHTGVHDGLMPGRMDGVNQHGLWVSFNAQGALEPQVLRPGLPFHAVVRILLETCTSAREAVAWLESKPLLTPGHYLAVDSHDMLHVETHPEAVRVLLPADGILVVTNHYQHPDLVGLDRSPIAESSRRRHEVLLKASRRALAGDDPLDTIVGAMSDHTAPVCGHTDGLATFWSSLCRPRTRQLWYSRGAPCRNRYRSIPWPGPGAEVAADDVWGVDCTPG